MRALPRRLPLFVATAHFGAAQTLMIMGIFSRASCCAISMDSRTLSFNALVAAAPTGAAASSGCQRSSGMATRPQATRRWSRLY